ncbi:MAG: chorismate-binding protein, partial [Thauera sp.]|nr:chorismate-binding protein [Thauera sp.]
MLEQEFNRLAAAGYNRIPVTLETFADLDTPLSIYLKLANAPYTYLLESVQGGERFGRYSIIGLAASTRLEVRENAVKVIDTGRVVDACEARDPLEFIADFMAGIRVPPRDGLPRFAGGLVGCFGYDTVRYIEPRLGPCRAPDALGTPDIVLLLSEEIAIVDNLSGKLTLVVYADPARDGAYAAARARLAQLVVRLREPVAIPPDVRAPSAPAESSFGEEGFKAAVRRAKQYIVDGDIMQVVLSQRMSKPFAASPLALYRAIRSLNPSPYMFYFDLGDFHVVGASPEILVRLDDDTGDRRVTVRPIAGTRKRGATPEEDLALERELLSDQKELAEHLQLLDLGRNDAGRVADIGTVKVTERFTIERYSHVMHIVSNV